MKDKGVYSDTTGEGAQRSLHLNEASNRSCSASRSVVSKRSGWNRDEKSTPSSSLATTAFRPEAAIEWQSQLHWPLSACDRCSEPFSRGMWSTCLCSENPRFVVSQSTLGGKKKTTVLYSTVLYSRCACTGIDATGAWQLVRTVAIDCVWAASCRSWPSF